MPSRPIPRGPKAGRPTGRFTQHRRLDKLREVLTQHPSGLLLEELAGFLRVTTRSVRRYLRELDRATELESVETTPGGAHRWRIKPSERGRTVALRRAQAYGLLAARRVFEPMKGSALYDELDVVMRQVLQVAQRPTKSAGEVPADNRLEERFVYVPSPARSYGARVEELDSLFQSVAELRVMRFRYKTPLHERDGRGERVTSHPYALVVHRGAVFAIARDVDRDGTRVFAFDRMNEVHPSDHERFDLPDGFDANDFVHGDFGVADAGAHVRVLIEFEPRAAEEIRARRFHPSQKIATAPDGRLRLSMTVPDLDDLRAWILSFGGTARVIEPPALAREVASELKRALGRY